jgi:hypothetical protein
VSLNRVSNARKLRRLAALVGEPVVRAYAKFFADHVLLVFGASGRQYAVDGDRVEPYAADPPLVLTEHGIGSRQP